MVSDASTQQCRTEHLILDTTPLLQQQHTWTPASGSLDGAVIGRILVLQQPDSVAPSFLTCDSCFFSAFRTLEPFAIHPRTFTMDQPQIHMRRHNSLPANRSGSRLFLRNVSNRFNPHVGTFRHAPPSTRSLDLTTAAWRTGTSTRLARNQAALTLMNRNCPYTGSFRHAPPAHATKPWLETLLWELLSLSYSQNASVRKLSDLLMISGHLRGGGGSYWREQEAEHRQRQLRAPTAVSSVLVKLACWILFGEQPKSSSSLTRSSNKSFVTSSSLHSRQDSISDESSINTDDDTESEDMSCCTNSSNSLPPPLRGAGSTHTAMVSSQAEAYYAHAMVNKETTTPDTTDDDVIANLDYTVSITQMDVMRMMRNASRHLDVESIVQLPVITYQPPNKAKVPGGGTDDHEQASHSSMGSFTSVDESTATPEEMSWLLIQRQDQQQARDSSTSSALTRHLDRRNQDKQEDADDGNHDHICVICLEHFVAGDRLRVLPCQHSFHVGCIDRWLSGSSSFDDCYTSGCPTCKKRPDVAMDDDAAATMHGSVPSWAFARIGNALATSQME